MWRNYPRLTPKMSGYQKNVISNNFLETKINLTQKPQAGHLPKVPLAGLFSVGKS